MQQDGDTFDDLKTRRDTAAALTSAGYPIAPATLATMASRGGGPRFVRFGARVLYPWAEALSWARARTTDPVSSTSELRRATRK